jgi:REP element-mobilizing transposase RayT
MARPLRIEFPGALYHVTSRGNARQPIFLDDRDRLFFLDRLGEVVRTHRWRCHSYCLMPNHYHVLMETPEPNLSRGMRRLNARYSQHFNRRHERVGHVLQGRFHAVVVERDTHLLELARYIVLNPVRAGLLAAAEEYPWSSLRSTLGVEPSPPWLDSARMLSGFGSRNRYLAFVREGLAARSPWAALRGHVLGSDGFVESLAGRIDPRAVEPEFGRTERLVHRQPLESALPATLIVDRARRNARIRELAESGRYTAAEIGRHLGLHYSTVCRILTAPAGPAAGCAHSRSDPAP